MCLQEYGHTKIQKKIIKLGRENRLTVKKILDLFGKENKRDAVDEIEKLIEMKLVERDKKTTDDKRNIYENSRLIWKHKKGDALPFDLGEVIHDPVADFMYETEDHFYLHFYKKQCQRCGKNIKHEDPCCSSLKCDIDFDEDNKISGWSSTYDMIVLCKSCLNELETWLNIPTKDSFNNNG